METIPCPEATDQWLSFMSANGHPTNTTRAYASDLRDLLQNWNPEDSFATNATTRLNRLRLTLSPKTIERKLTAYRSFARFNGDPNLLAGYRCPRPARPEPHPIPEGVGGVLRMIETADTPQRKALVALCGLVGLRVSEACSITVDSIDELHRTVRLVGKGARERVVPLSDAAWDAIAPALKETQPGSFLVGVAERRARDLITIIARRAGLERHVKSHDLRATLATAAYDKSKDLRAVQEILGHASSRTTEAYTFISQDAMRHAAEVVVA